MIMIRKRFLQNYFEYIEQGESMNKKKEMATIQNKPLFWSIYGIYCAIPVVIYALYLWKRAREV